MIRGVIAPLAPPPPVCLSQASLVGYVSEAAAARSDRLAALVMFRQMDWTEAADLIIGGLDMSLIKMSENYSDVLRRVATAAFVGGFVYGWLVLEPLTAPDQLLGQILSDLPPVLGYSGRWAVYAMVGLLAAAISRFMLIHDKVSDFFALRHRFDVNYILTPLMGHADFKSTLDNVQRLHDRRHDLMADVFYRYAGSSNAKINKHLIAVALDKWSWVWIAVEHAVFAGMAGILLAATQRPFAAYICASISLMLTACVAVRPKGRIAAARDQVREIVKKKSRVSEIREAFSRCGIE